MIKLPRWEDWTADFIQRVGQQCINIARGFAGELPNDWSELMGTLAPLEDTSTWNVIIHFIAEVHVDSHTRDIARETKEHIARETGEINLQIQAALRGATNKDTEAAFVMKSYGGTDADIKITKQIATLEREFLAECARVDNIEATISIMNTSAEESARKAAFDVYINRCARNRELLPQIAKLRLELARAAGFDSYREYIWAHSQRRMINDPIKFCEEIKPALISAARKEAQKLYGSPSIPYWNWKHSISDRESGNLDTALADYTREYGVTFTSLSASVWAPDVTCVAVTLRDGRRGIVYMDLYPRDGKFNHAATYLLRPPNGKYCSIQAVLCSLSRIWTLENTVTLYHELGHVIHHASMQVKYRDSVNVEMDFIEVPSRLMELYVHPHPPDWAIAELRQLVLAEYDFELHGPNPPKNADECATLMRRVFEQTPLSGDVGNFFASFAHYVEMYPAYYYCYVAAGIWAERLYKKIQTGERTYADLIPIFETGAKAPTLPMLEQFIN